MLQLKRHPASGRSPFRPGEERSLKRNELYSTLSIGERLRITRLSIGVTQKGMAHPLSVTREAYTMYETGYRDPPWPIAVEICDSWGVSLDWIYRGDLSSLPMHLVEKINRNLSKARTRVI